MKYYFITCAMFLLQQQGFSQVVLTNNQCDFYLKELQDSYNNNCIDYKISDVHRCENQCIYLECNRGNCSNSIATEDKVFIKINGQGDVLFSIDEMPADILNDINKATVCQSYPEDYDSNDSLNLLRINGKSNQYYTFSSMDYKSSKVTDSINAKFVVSKFDDRTGKLIWKTGGVDISKSGVFDGMQNQVEHFHVAMDNAENSYTVFRNTYYGFASFQKTKDITRGIKKIEYKDRLKNQKGLTVVKYNAEGKLLWNKAFMDFGMWPGYGCETFCIVLDNVGNCFITGMYHDTRYIDMRDVNHWTFLNGEIKYFFAKINSDGQVFLSLNNDDQNEMTKMIPDDNGSLWVLYKCNAHKTGEEKYVKKINFVPLEKNVGLPESSRPITKKTYGIQVLSLLNPISNEEELKLDDLSKKLGVKYDKQLFDGRVIYWFGTYSLQEARTFLPFYRALHKDYADGFIIPLTFVNGKSQRVK